MKWRCSFHSANGVRCEKEAVLRLHYHKDHPFDFVDTCREHLQEYRHYQWRQTLVRSKNDREEEEENRI